MIFVDFALSQNLLSAYMDFATGINSPGVLGFPLFQNFESLMAAPFVTINGCMDEASARDGLRNFEKGQSPVLGLSVTGRRAACVFLL